MTRSKTKRMKQALQGLIPKIKEKEDQCELRVAPNCVTLLQIDEDVLRST